VVYPATSLHHVKPVTRGTRLASFFWLPSMIRDDGARSLLFDPTKPCRNFLPSTVADAACVYHNLIRYRADV